MKLLEEYKNFFVNTLQNVDFGKQNILVTWNKNV